MIAKLIPLNGKPPISITADVTVVGRKRGLCDIVLDDPSISKVHGVLAKTDGLLFFRDLGSTNGMKVNGQRVSRGALIPGDELSFASFRFRVHLGPGQPEVGHHEPTEVLPLPSLPFDSMAEPFGIPAAPDSQGDLGLRSNSDVRLLPKDSHVEPVY
ncbi:MAG: FHA domain-containing protein [Planctomycetaceae bacterium]|nr:FHA domain-containing protein [Planctomycetaceae bacterium]